MAIELNSTRERYTGSRSAQKSSRDLRRKLGTRAMKSISGIAEQVSDTVADLPQEQSEALSSKLILDTVVRVDICSA